MRSVLTRTARGDRHPGRVFGAVWGALLGVGATAGLVVAAMFGPSDRRNAFLAPEIALDVALVAGAVAIPAMLILVVLRVPDRRCGSVGETIAVLIGMLTVAVLIARFVVGTNDERGFAEADLAWWFPLAILQSLLFAGVAVRCDVARRS